MEQEIDNPAPIEQDQPIQADHIQPNHVERVPWYLDIPAPIEQDHIQPNLVEREVNQFEKHL